RDEYEQHSGEKGGNRYGKPSDAPRPNGAATRTAPAYNADKMPENSEDSFAASRSNTWLVHDGRGRPLLKGSAFHRRMAANTDRSRHLNSNRNGPMSRSIRRRCVTAFVRLLPCRPRSARYLSNPADKSARDELMPLLAAGAGKY